DKVLYIDAPRDLRLSRLAARSGWTPAELTAREAAQWSAEAKKAHADAVVINDGTREQFQERIDRVLSDWIGGN
ncbi:MAG: dephospho-CoA kinase, partial [Fimbriiglobus sp.]|nr:dephospho-CoA kinase [Fimbriiglobus sp.]